LKRQVAFETLYLLVLIIASSLVRYWACQTSPYETTFYKHLYIPARDLIHNGIIPIRYSSAVPFIGSYGPALIYLYAPFFLVINGLKSLVFFSIFLEGASIYLLYRIGRDFYSRSVGFFMTILYALSFFVISSAGNYINGYLMRPFFLLFLYFLFKVKVEGRTAYFVALFLSASVLLQTHWSAFIIVPILLILLFQRAGPGAFCKWIGIFGFILVLFPVVLNVLLAFNPRVFGVGLGDKICASAVGQRIRDHGGPDDFFGSFEDVIPEENEMDRAGLTSEGCRGKIVDLWNVYRYDVYFFTYMHETFGSAGSAGIIFFLCLNAFGVGFGIFRAYGVLRELKKTSWNRELIWTALFFGELLLLLIDPHPQNYHFSAIHIITIALVSVMLGQIWEGGPDGQPNLHRAASRVAVIFIVTLVCALNLHASYDEIMVRQVRTFF